MGRLLADMTTKMQHKIDRKESDPLKMLVHSTHDTAIAALCQTFDVYDDKCVFAILNLGLLLQVTCN